jgi:hypothetical protein
VTVGVNSALLPPKLNVAVRAPVALGVNCTPM